MKKLCILAIAFITLQATAQESKKDLSKTRIEKAKEMSAEETAQIQTKKLTLELDLTESQQKEVNALLLEQAKARAEKKENFNKNSETKPVITKEDRVKLVNERLDGQIAMKAKMKTILNAEQYAKWEQKMTTKTGGKRHFAKNKNLKKE